MIAIHEAFILCGIAYVGTMAIVLATIAAISWIGPDVEDDDDDE